MLDRSPQRPDSRGATEDPLKATPEAGRGDVQLSLMPTVLLQPEHTHLRDA